MANFTFICGDDDFLVQREAKAAFERMAEGLDDDFSKEVIDATVTNLDGVQRAIDAFKAAVRTLSMFGDRKVVWLKDVNFIADTVTGRSEGAKTLCAQLQAELASIDPTGVGVVISASPILRTRKEYKWLSKNGDTTDFKTSGSDGAGALDVVIEEARSLGVTLEEAAARALIGKVAGNTRLCLEEVRKLAAYVNYGEEPITEALVMALVPNFGEGDFFEPAEAFFSGNLKWTLDAIHRYFFTGKDARPLLTNLQNRGRLCLQLRALMDAGDIKLGPRGLSKGALESAFSRHADAFDGDTTKSNYNIFSQNAWYLGNKIGPSAERFNLRQLGDFQTAFTAAFEGIVNHYDDQEGVLRDLAIRCLS